MGRGHNRGLATPSLTVVSSGGGVDEILGRQHIKREPGMKVGEKRLQTVEKQVKSIRRPYSENDYVDILGGVSPGATQVRGVV